MSAHPEQLHDKQKKLSKTLNFIKHKAELLPRFISTHIGYILNCFIDNSK